MHASRNHPSCIFFVSALLGLVLVPAARASVHLMQIEQVIGGVNGDVTAQAVQLRMRANGQNQTQNSRLVVWDAAGANPIVLATPAASVANSGMGSRVLFTTAAFDAVTNPPAVPDFPMNAIPAAYLPAGSLTFENASGTIIWWRLSWGGAAYSGSTMGSGTNDADGDFGPPYPDALPSAGSSALLFQGAAGALSTSNDIDYALTPGATFINNASGSFNVPVHLIFHGIANVATGQAQINFIPAPPKTAPDTWIAGHNHLVVSNIGSSGDDGVDVTDGANRVVYLPLPDAASTTDGFQVNLTAVGTLGVIPDQDLASTSFTDVGSQYQLAVDFTPMGGSSVRYEFYDNGNLVHAELNPSSVLALAAPSACEFRSQCVPHPTPDFPTTASTMYLPPPCFRWEWDSSTDVQVPGQGSMTVDEVRVLSDMGADLLLGTMELRISDPSVRPADFTIVDETLRVLGHGLRAAGDAEITLKLGAPHKTRSNNWIRHNRHLTVSNIGSSGMDGVCLEPDPGSLGLGILWEPIDPGMPPGTGASLHLDVHGSIVGGPSDMLVATTTMSGTGSGGDIVFDLSPIGASTATVEILDDGQLVHSTSGFVGSIATDAWPIGVGQRHTPSPSTLEWHFENAQLTVGGVPIQGDVLQIRPETVDSVVDDIQRIVVLCSTIPGDEIEIIAAPNDVPPDPTNPAWLAATGLGIANITKTRGEDIVLGNIGASGDDGVCLDLDDTLDIFRTDWAPLGNSDLHWDGNIIVAPRGKLVGDANPRSLGSFELQNTAGTIALTTDYSPIGATQVRVRVIDNHAAVADFLLPDGIIGTMTTWPGSCGKSTVDIDGTPTMCFWIDPGEDAEVDYAGGPMAGKPTMKIATDLIQILAADASAPLESIHTWDMRLANIPFLLMHEIDEQYPTATSDRGAPRVNVLHPSYPNPFNARVTLAFDLVRPSHVTLQIVSPRGRLVATLLDAPAPAGRRTLVWNGLDQDGREVASGTYLVRLQAPGGALTSKVTLLK